MNELHSATRFRAMVLAAGFGTRLEPLSLLLPKPLIPLSNRPLLDHILERLFGSGIEDVAVNGHHLRGQLHDFLRQHPRSSHIAFFEEEEILGTGGALDHARDFLRGAEHFILHNGDVLSNVQLDHLMQVHIRSGAWVTLVLVPNGPEAKVVVTEAGRVIELADKIGSTPNSPTMRCTYTGIAAFSQRFLQFLPPGQSSLTDALIRAIRTRPNDVRGFVPNDIYWNDLGTFDRYFQAHRDLLSDAIPHFPPQDIEFLAEQGSDRQFLRLRSGAKSFVLMLSPDRDPDFSRFIKIGAFLHDHDLGPAKIVAHHVSQRAVLMEDLGDQTLLNLAHTADPATVTHWIEQAVRLLVTLQTLGSQKARSLETLWQRRLDFEQLRWESDYFSTYFLDRFLGIHEQDNAKLAAEFDTLARQVEGQPQVLIHRDYQSTNLLIHAERMRIVDFQGARFGPIAYDLASLLLDPYHTVHPDTIARMLAIYRRVLARHSTLLLSPRQLELFFLQAGMQRLMQALGAYGFLTLEKSKPFFIAFMAPGLERLECLIEKLKKIAPNRDAPELARIVASARQRLAQRTR